MEKRKHETNPLIPFVTEEQIKRFDRYDPSTNTASPILNAVCLAVEEVGFMEGKKICRYLEVDNHKLSCALQLICGMNLTELRHLLLRNKYEKAHKEHPEWDTEQLLNHLGITNRSTLFRLLGRKKYDDEVALYARD